MWVITGATGFIGSALVWELNERGLNDLILVDHVKPEERGQLLQKRKFKSFHTADEFLKLMETGPLKVEGVLHMGACSNTTETDEEYLTKNNLVYSQKVFEFCARERIPLIYASSAATYGDGRLGFDD